jgi:hypothetical protein
MDAHLQFISGPSWASFSLHYLFVMQNMSTAALAHMTESCVKDRPWSGDGDEAHM